MKDFYIIYDAATGAELMRGSGPSGAAALQERPGRVVVTKTAAEMNATPEGSTIDIEGDAA